MKKYNVTYRKEILNEETPGKEKGLSIFEVHTDYINQDKRKSEFDHKINFIKRVK